MKLDVQGRAAYAYTGGKPFDPALPAVVLIHGAQNDHSVWALQSRALAHHGHAVLAVDLPGHGRSAGPALADVEACADWIVALLETALNAPRQAIDMVTSFSISSLAPKPSSPGPGASTQVMSYDRPEQPLVRTPMRSVMPSWPLA